MAQQLRLEGDPIFEPTATEVVFKQLFIDPIREELNRPSILLFNSNLSYERRPSYTQLPLFEPTPECMAYFDVDDRTLWCHLDSGHKGPHWDATLRVSWQHG